MKILMINKFLYPNGGSETYIFRLGGYLEKQGHQVQYFGMEHENRCVGNRIGSYTSNMDFHEGSRISKLAYPMKIVYSREARRKIRLVLDDFQPDVCHLNNFNYQLTPSIILEIAKWRKESGHKCRIIYTAHDYQLICPDHMLNNPNSHENCERCLGGHFFNCVKGKCIHGSTARSVVGAAEAYFWNWKGVYKNIDAVICCSEFMKRKLDNSLVLKNKTIVMHNFIDKVGGKRAEKKNYVLYFGRYSWEKGVRTLIEACKMLPDVRFVFAGNGMYQQELEKLPNIKNVGFMQGDALDKLIQEARFSICPSECYENCPFSVIESQLLGTPVLGADIGGIPELIRVGETGELFKSGDEEELTAAIRRLWDDRKLTDAYSRNCWDVDFDTVEDYYKKILKIYQG